MSNKINILLNAILSKDSVNSINGQIETLQRQLDEIKLDGQLAKQLEALEKIDLSNLTVNTGKAEKEIQKTVDGLDKIKVKQKEISDQQVEIGFLFDDKEIRRDFEGLKKHVEDSGGKLKWEIDTTDGRNEITKLSAVYEDFGKTTEKVFNKVQTSDGHLVWDVTKLKEVDSVVRDTAKAFNEVDNALKNSVDAGSITVKQFNQMSESLQKVKDNKDGISEISRELSKMNESSKYVDKLNNQMRELASQGKLSAKDMQHFNETISQSGNINKKTYEELSFSIKQVGRENKLVEKEMQEELRKREQALKRIEELQTKMIRTQQRQPKVQKDGLYGETVDMLNQMHLGKHTVDLEKLNSQITKTSQNINRMAANATEAGRTQIGIVDSFKIALEKFPVWMATTTVFYGTIRSAREFMSIIIDIDTKMTDLRKVMADGTDFSGVFDDATESARQFGQTISDTMDAYIEFARQGFEGNQLKDLADAALVFSNVSELNTADAAGHLTATIVQYNKEASEAMRITDNWNEIGNNFSTTSSAVAEGVNKSASVAKAMGMELEELNAMVAQLTASTKQSGAEIGNMIKSVLPRLTSKPAQAALDSLNVSLTDAQGNLRNVIEVYRDVGIAIQDMDGLQKASIAEGLGGKFHISRILSLLDDLAKVDSMYDQIMESQQGAAGSAIEENEEYMKSFEARLASTRRSVEELALAMGDAFLSESMVQGLKLFTSALQDMTKATETIGVLPVVLSLAGAAFLTFSKSARTWAQALIFGTKEMEKHKRELISLEENLTRGSTATKLFERSWKTMISGLGVTIGLVAVGLAFEYILSKITETRQRAEELQNQLDGQRREYSANADEINRLTDEYAELEKRLKNSSLSEEERTQTTERMLAVQKELSNIMPSMVIAEDEYGNVTYETAQSIKARNEIMEQQIAIEKERQRLEEQASRFDLFKQQEKDAKAFGKTAEHNLTLAQNWLTITERSLNLGDGFFEIDINSVEDARDAINRLNEERQKLLAEGDEKGANKAQIGIDKITESANLAGLALKNVESASFGMLETLSYSFNEVVHSTNAIGDSTKAFLSGFTMMIHEAGASTDDAEKLFNSLSYTVANDKTFQSYAKNYEGLLNDLERAKKAYDATPSIANEETLRKSVEAVQNAYQGMINHLMDILRNSGIEDMSVLDGLEKQFEQELIGMLAQTKTLEEIAETTGQSVEEVALTLQMLGDEAGDAGDAVGDLSDDVNHLESVLEKITGTTLDSIDATWELVEEYEKLYNLLQFLEEGTEEFDIAQQHLLAIEKKLLDIFPQLRVQKEKYGATTQDLIALSKREVQETDIVQSAYHDLSNGMLDANQQRVLSSYNASKAIINNLKQEQAAYKMSLDNAGKQLMRLSQIKNPTEEQKAMINSLDSTVRARSKGLESYGKAIEYNENALQKSINTMKTFPTYSDRNTERTEKNSKANKSNTKAKKDNTKATKEKAKEEELASFIADKYRRAIEELNYALKQQQAIKSQFPKHSKEYQNALKAELKLEQQRLKLMQNQTKELQNAVKAGKAPQTGVVSAKQQTKAQTVTTNRKLSGWQAPVNSGFGQRWGRMHEGVDIAQAKGTRLDANVAGIVKRAMNHKTYGNVVYVVDNTGKEHRYAHLNNINVKQGQRVNVGDQLGAIGSTGRSSGPHLHYEVRVNGKAVNPMDFVKAAKGNKAITTQVKEVSNVSKEVAQAQASVYDVQGQILDLQGNIIDQQIKIAELQAEMIRAELAQFDKRRETYGYHLDYEATKYEQVAKTSQRYLNVLARQEAFMIKKQNTNKEELTQLDKLIKSGNLQGSVLEEVTKRYQDLRIEISNTNTELSKLKEQQIDAQLYKWILNTETFDFELAKLEQNLRLATEGTEHWLNLMNQKSSYLESQRSAIKQEINQLTELLKMSNLLTPDAIEKYQRRLRELTLQYREMGITLLDINDQQEKLAKGEINAWNEIADKMISTYKKAMEQKREIQQKALDKEMEAEDKRHKKAIENLNKELDKYREIINEKLKEIDKEDEDRTFNREIQELQDERQQIQAEINLLKADNTRDAKYRREKLQEDLLKIDQKIADKNYQREKEQRKDNLNEMLSDKEKEIKDREELENNYHESEKDRIDKLKEYWNQYYTDRINDERKFSQWRKDLANGEYEHILKLFDDLAIELEDSLQDITNTLDGTMEGVGTSIRVNIIDELREAIRVAKEFSNVISNGKDGSGIDLSAGLGNSTGTKPVKSQYEHRDYQVIAGKLIRHNLSQYAQTEAKELELRKHGSDLANGGRTRGSKLDKLVRYDELIKNMNTSDIEGFTAYLERYIRQLGNADYELKDWLAREVQRLRLSASFDSGGFTGSWGKSGKLATLHQNELILNEKETNKFGNLISKFDGLSRMLDSLTLGSSTAQSSNYVMEVNIENFTGTEENARSLGEILNDEWTNKFRVERGMRG